MYGTRSLTRAAAVTVVVTVAVTAMTAVAAPPTVAKGVATVSASEYRHVDNGMTTAQVHDAVGGAPKSVRTQGKHTIETFRGWDHGSHALVLVTYKTTDGHRVVSAKTTKAAGGGGGGGCGCGTGRL